MAQHPGRERALAEGTHTGVVPAVECRVRAVAIGIVQIEPGLDVAAALAVRPEHVERRPLAVMRLQLERGLAEILREAKELVGALPAHAVIHRRAPRAPECNEMVIRR